MAQKATLAGLGALILCMTLAAGCANVARYGTNVDRVDGLESGAPVVYQGAVIGSVSEVTPLPDGRNAVEFEVSRSYAPDIHQDSIMVLRTGPGGAALDLMNPDPLSPAAPPGSMIAGASSQAEANLMLAGQGLKGFVAELGSFLGSVGTTLQNPSISPAYNQMQQDLLEIERELAAAGARNTALINQQWQRVNREAASLEQELIRQGKSAEAERLRRELERFARTLTTPGSTPPPSTPPNTLVTPRVR
jgi:MlaD protein